MKRYSYFLFLPHLPVEGIKLRFKFNTTCEFNQMRTHKILLISASQPWAHQPPKVSFKSQNATRSQKPRFPTYNFIKMQCCRAFNLNLRLDDERRGKRERRPREIWTLVSIGKVTFGVLPMNPQCADCRRLMSSWVRGRCSRSTNSTEVQLWMMTQRPGWPLRVLGHDSAASADTEVRLRGCFV